MTQVQNKNFIAFDGTPITGRVPAQVIVYANDGYKVPQELYGAVAHAYKLFCDSYNTSVAPFHVANRTFPDGSRVRMESNQGKDRIFLWPVGGGENKYLRLYWLQSFFTDGGFDEKPPNGHNELLPKLHKITCFEGEDNEIFFRNISLDGVLEIWAEMNSREYRAGGVITHKDESEDVADDDGLHVREVDVWFAGDRSISASDKFVPMPCAGEVGSVPAFGNPYHGAIIDGCIEDVNGNIPVDSDYVSWPNTQLVKFDGVPESPAELSDLWRNCAILHGKYRSYYPVLGKVIAFGMHTHLYRADDWTAYTISFQWDVLTSTLTIVSKKCFVIPQGAPEQEEIEIYSEVIWYPDPWQPVPHSLDPDPPPYEVLVYPRFVVSPNGKKVSILFSAILKSTPVESLYDHRVIVENLAVYECVISGGSSDIQEITCGMGLIIAYNELYENTSDYVGLKYGYCSAPIPEIETDVVVFNGHINGRDSYTRTITYVDWQAVPLEWVSVDNKYRRKRIVGAFYNSENVLQCIESEVTWSWVPSETWGVDPDMPTTFVLDYETWGAIGQYSQVLGVYTDASISTMTCTRKVTNTAKHIIYTNGIPETVSESSATQSFFETSTRTYGYNVNSGKYCTLYSSETYTTSETYSCSRQFPHPLSYERAFVPETDFGAFSAFFSEYLDRWYMTSLASNNVVIYPLTDNTGGLCTGPGDYNLSMERVKAITPSGTHDAVIDPESLSIDGNHTPGSYGGNNGWHMAPFPCARPTVSWNPVTDELLFGANKTWI